MKNNRTFLEKLLDGAEVEWKPLKDILIRTKGTKITAAEMKILHKDNAPLKIFAGGKTFALVNFEDIPEKDINKNPSIIVKSRGIIEFEYYDKPFSHKNEMWSYYSNDKNINIKYIYYVLKNQEPYFQNLGSKMQMPQIATPDTDKYLVPIPPLSVQTEIVKILDALTALTSELTSELILRRKQYEYYREKLLSEEELAKVVSDWKYLTQVADLTRGRVISKEYLSDNVGDYPVYSSQTVNNGEIGKINSFDFDGEFVSWTTDGANAGTAFYRSGKFSITNVCGLIKIKNSSELNYKFLFYWLSIEAKKHVYSGMGNPKLMSHQMEKIKIPIPPLSVQTKIVKILDKFESLTNSITEGLPLAIEQSQKRYEYYRELLLNFPGRE
ncbi:type I restriction modification DNA specificity domain protein [Aggregatibacter sp. oral taxon 458 str. W10330]|uniref:restriction endonuclease subunit S n=1 Tax=Aggregatibacter sp. oral taxon 458 TaxID=712148 RepID=UPI0003968A32|nr:restriction endonuclease subunit S [Aggregatibacter sp. oral taxon 458]ERH28810.1 type I restriction modification DNA specificity domain protein [Aggregatibacter sp. oral taxon 458 str. W10330]